MPVIERLAEIFTKDDNGLNKTPANSAAVVFRGEGRESFASSRPFLVLAAEQAEAIINHLVCYHFADFAGSRNVALAFQGPFGAF